MINQQLVVYDEMNDKIYLSMAYTPEEGAEDEDAPDVLFFLSGETALIMPMEYFDKNCEVLGWL